MAASASDYILSKYPFRRIDTVLIFGMIVTFVVVGILKIGFGVFSIDTDPLRTLLINLMSGVAQ